MAYWLIKSEPFVYSWDQFVQDGRTCWDGVRNYSARINLRAMKKGDQAFYYHSNEGKEIVGIAKVVREAYQDPTTEEDWSAVDFAPVRPLTHPVTHARIKTEPSLAGMALMRLSRLSVQPVTDTEWKRILKLSEETSAG
jgi:predicted RNA-binding protein with PUA-like domain